MSFNFQVKEISFFDTSLFCVKNIFLWHVLFPCLGYKFLWQPWESSGGSNYKTGQWCSSCTRGKSRISPLSFYCAVLVIFLFPYIGIYACYKKAENTVYREYLPPFYFRPGCQRLNLRLGKFQFLISSLFKHNYVWANSHNYFVAWMNDHFRPQVQR